MFIHRLVNRLVQFANAVLMMFGHRVDQQTGHRGERRLWLHWSNENEDGHGKPKGAPWHGRLWLHVNTRRSRTFRWTWNLGHPDLSACMTIGTDEDDLALHIGLLFASFWFSASGIWLGRFRDAWQRRYSYNERELSLRVFDKGIWWHVWSDPNNWSSLTPRWRDGCWHPIDTILGRQKYTSEAIATQDVIIPMPEGGYAATVKLTLDSWKRPRAPWMTKRHRAQIDLKQPIPHEGKGENPWDCGKDGLYGLSTPAASIPEAIANTVRSALESRRRYDGDAMAKYPAPTVSA